ncbi:cell wall-binding repeat-containing protein [Stomatohabitans albus]|uniref:cell wall-binding repeat-containing protein n=1 Tax=Stomatohabitans albus TaxID=3110766 RepID=UPI00300C4602
MLQCGPVDAPGSTPPAVDTNNLLWDPARGRESGSDVSVQASKLAWPNPGMAEYVVIAGECAYADALVSTSLAAKGPLLLTDPTKLEDTVKHEIVRLGVKKIYIVGGEQAITPAVADALKALGVEVERISGETRLGTAKRLAQTMSTKPGTPVIIARGYPADGGTPSQAFADAMAAAYYSPHQQSPIALSETTKLSSDVAQLLGAVKPAQVTVMGGHAALFEGMEQAVRSAVGTEIPVNRIAGVTRADTAAKLARAQISAGKANGVLVIEGQADDAWKVGYTFAGLAVKTNSVYALASGDDLAPETIALIKEAKAKNLPVRCVANTKACVLANSL